MPIAQSLQCQWKFDAEGSILQHINQPLDVAFNFGEGCPRRVNSSEPGNVQANAFRVKLHAFNRRNGQRLLRQRVAYLWLQPLLTNPIGFYEEESLGFSGRRQVRLNCLRVEHQRP